MSKMDSSGIRANMSEQQLLNDGNRRRRSSKPDQLVDDSSGSSSLSSSQVKLDGKEPLSSNSTSDNSVEIHQPQSRLTKRQIISVAILCFVNLINYMDRYTIAGILTLIQCDLKIGDTEGGLLQTAFVGIYMICAPIFGYLGDRYSRRLIMAGGIFVWSLTTLLGSYMTNFWTFLAMRALVGVGEASYSTIAPTIISDLFVGDTRSKFLALFYFAIPVGSGLGYIVGSEAAKMGGSWHWGLRVTPLFGAIATLLILFVVQDPPRGESEGAHLSTTSWWDDIKSLGKNKSFIMSTAACTAVAFVAGALAWWGPKFIALGLANQPDQQHVTLDDVSFIFGLIAMLAGLLGVPLGSFLGQKLRVRYQRADPIVCGVGLLLSTPLMLAALFVAKMNTTGCFVIIFFGQLLLNLNWAIVADILLYVVIPTRRSTAEAFQILFSHALGDAGSPYLIGQVSELLKSAFSPNGTMPNNVASSTLAISATESAFSHTATAMVNAFNSTLNAVVSDGLAVHGVEPFNCSNAFGSTALDLNSVETDFKALQYAMSITIAVELLGALFFFATAWYIVEDKAKVDRAVAGAAEANPSLAVHETTRIPSDNAIEDASLAQQSTTASLASGSSGFINHALEA